MIVLAIDPGTRISGFSIIKKEQRSLHVLDYGLLTLTHHESLIARVGAFFDFFKEKIEKFNVTAIAIETPFLGKNAANFLKLGYLRGAVYILVSHHNLILYEYSPSEVKRALTGYGSADKEQIARMILRLFPGLEFPGKYDLTDAFAVCMASMWKN